MSGRRKVGVISRFQSSLPSQGTTKRRVREHFRHSVFQSSLPSQGATSFISSVGMQNTYFNPRSPRRERPRSETKRSEGRAFQSTLPSQGATQTDGTPYPLAPISIHAPLSGSDLLLMRLRLLEIYFNPRSPLRERQHQSASKSGINRYFNPRSPRRERPIRRSVRL